MDKRKEYTREYLEETIIGQIQGITIPVNVRVMPRQRVFEFQELARIIEGATTLSQSECGCRERMGNCDNPREGCIALDEHAEMWNADGTGHEVSKEEALEALKNGVEHGLVNVAYVFDKDKAEIICTCCECCCDSLAAMLRFGYSDQVLVSKMIAVQDEGSCTDCGACVDACHFKARTMVDGRMVFDDGRCAGCGLCVHACEVDAISMVERETGGTEVPFP